MDIHRSAYTGLLILWVDSIGIAHSGVIVGQSASGATQFVQSDNPRAAPARWHFKVPTAAVPALLRH